MTATLSASPHHNLHVLPGGAVRAVLVIEPDTTGVAPGERSWVVYSGDGDGAVAVRYSAPNAELRSGQLDHELFIHLGAAQAEVATYRFHDVRDGSENDATLGADLRDGGTRWLHVTNVADAIDTLNAALDIISDWEPSARTRRERRATRSLRDRLVALAVA